MCRSRRRRALSARRATPSWKDTWQPADEGHDLPSWANQGVVGATFGHPAPLLVKLDVIGKLVTLSEREAEELRAAAAAEAGRSSARRDLSLLLARGLRTQTTVALNRAEARELAELLTSGCVRADLALLQEALREALEDAPP